MIAASRPRAGNERARLLVIDPEHDSFHHAAPMDLPTLLEPRDLVVVNDAATLPASLVVRDRQLEVRLVGRGNVENEYRAVVFGKGDYRTPTEERPPPPEIREGETLDFGADLQARVVRVDPESPRLLELRFSLHAAALLRALYRHGRPIQYAYVPERLALWDVQNRFGARPWAFELPSAGQIFDGELLLALRGRGTALATLTHAAGISSTGSPALDARFPLPERFEIPWSTARAVEHTRSRGGRILAVGTTVVRALESAAMANPANGANPVNGANRMNCANGEGEARLVLGPGYRPAIADGILSGMHEAGTSHFSLLEAFAPAKLLEHALEEAERSGYRQHEFGDFCLVWSARSARR